MKSFLKNNLSSIVNIAFIVLIFIYPIANITGLENKKIDTTPGVPFKISNNKIENSSDTNLNTYNFFLTKPAFYKEALLQTDKIYFSKR